MSAGIRGWADAVAGTFGGKMNNLKKIRMLISLLKTHQIHVYIGFTRMEVDLFLLIAAFCRNNISICRIFSQF
uniref:Putative ovule protein n=1 Tax=Solanum chacoense TaxID=4108 RepID=A0A0V0HYA1_SOLCH